MDRAIPALPALDLGASVAFYRRLGFAATLYDAYAVLCRGDVEIHLWATDDRHVAENSGCYLRVADVDAWHAALVAAGVPAAPPEPKPWGLREFHAFDPAGNLLRIGTPLQPRK
jgi:uncharacterized glyoxalase superfamily protein PhnB